MEQVTGSYAVWLEPVHLHFHHGDKVKVKVLWGRGMKTGNINDFAQWNVIVVDPAGVRVPAEMAGNDNAVGNLIAFNSDPEGIYTVQVENITGDFYPAGEDPGGKIKKTGAGNERNALCFVRSARLLVPVGHHIHGTGKSLNRGLEIVPGQFGDFHPGDSIDLTVLYEGQPLAGVCIYATYHLYEGNDFPHALITSEHGQVKFEFDARGHWMFQTSTRVGEVEHIATLVIPGVR